MDHLYEVIHVENATQLNQVRGLVWRTPYFPGCQRRVKKNDCNGLLQLISSRGCIEWWCVNFFETPIFENHYIFEKNQVTFR